MIKGAEMLAEAMQ